MNDQRDALICEAVAKEAARTSYPAGFPALPRMPAGRYTDPEFHELEMKRFWPKAWVHAGHISELPTPGSYKLFEQLNISIIISRGLDGELRAFHNVCQHRGSAVLLEKQGVARRFICPYHAWGYALDGSLTSVPEAHNFACLDKPHQGLVPVRCETMRGMIFINRDMNAMPLAQFMAAPDGQLGDFPLEEMVVKNIVTVEMECNWKTALDNFLEIYHVNTVHAKSIAPYLDSKSFSISLYKHGHARFATRKRGETIFGSDIETPDGPSALFKEHTVALPMFPNSFMAIDPVGFAWQSWWPLGTNRSVMVMYLMGWKGDDEADKAFWDGMTKQVTAIAGEDLVLFAEMQRNLESGVLPGLMMGYQERALYWYQEEIDRTIGAEHIPEQLRVAQLLAGHTAD